MTLSKLMSFLAKINAQLERFLKNQLTNSHLDLRLNQKIQSSKSRRSLFKTLFSPTIFYKLGPLTNLLKTIAQDTEEIHNQAILKWKRNKEFDIRALSLELTMSLPIFEAQIKINHLYLILSSLTFCSKITNDQSTVLRQRSKNLFCSLLEILQAMFIELILKQIGKKECHLQMNEYLTTRSSK